MEIEVCQFFSQENHLLNFDYSKSLPGEDRKEKLMVGNKIFTDQSSRGAIFLAKTLEKRNDCCSIFDKAKKFGTKIVLIEEMQRKRSPTTKKYIAL